MSAALGLVILAPLVLSGQDLYRWAGSPAGLGLELPWPAFVPAALDLAAVACIGMTIVAAWRRERPGAFGILVWVFAATSAYAQYTNGRAEQVAGTAAQAWWAMPAFALLGPALLELTLHTIRKWARRDAGQTFTGAAGFGVRWLPGVAFRETLRAWAASRREGIDQAADAVQFVRDRVTLSSLTTVEALRYAFGALGSVDPHRARVWLAVRGVTIDQAAIDQATEGRPIAPALPAVPVSAPPVETWTDSDTHAARMAGLTTKRDQIRYAFAVIGEYDQPAARTWLADRGVTVSRSEVHAVAKAAVSGPSGEFPTVPNGQTSGT